MQKQFPVSVDHLHQMLEFIRNRLLSAGIAGTTLSRIELAAEEALINVIRHSGLNNDSILDIECELDSGAIRITIKDSGIPFNPVEEAAHCQEKGNAEIPLEERELGGLGIYLISRLMDKIEYRREDQKNIITLIKLL